jgi:hypothetical protein
MISKLFRYLLVLTACLLLPYAWYQGFIPVADGPHKARLRHALNLAILPNSVSITAADHESWTDYLLFVEVSMEPEQLPELLRGRDFVRQELSQAETVTQASYIDGYVGFKIAEHWLWKDPATASAQGGDPCFCEVWFNAARDRAFIGYVAD